MALYRNAHLRWPRTSLFRLSSHLLLSSPPPATQPTPIAHSMRSALCPRRDRRRRNHCQRRPLARRRRAARWKGEASAPRGDEEPTTTVHGLCGRCSWRTTLRAVAPQEERAWDTLGNTVERCEGSLTGCPLILESQDGFGQSVHEIVRVCASASARDMKEAARFAIANKDTPRPCKNKPRCRRIRVGRCVCVCVCDE